MVNDDLKKLIAELKERLEISLATIGGVLIEFEPLTKSIEIEITPDTEDTRMLAALYVKDALNWFYEEKDSLIKSDPFKGVEQFIDD